jgi:hypothetical protein
MIATNAIIIDKVITKPINAKIRALEFLELILVNEYVF